MDGFGAGAGAGVGASVEAPFSSVSRKSFIVQKSFLYLLLRSMPDSDDPVVLIAELGCALAMPRDACRSD